MKYTLQIYDFSHPGPCAHLVQEQVHELDEEWQAAMLLQAARAALPEGHGAGMTDARGRNVRIR